VDVGQILRVGAGENGLLSGWILLPGIGMFIELQMV
jgi:hypothetical protein